MSSSAAANSTGAPIQAGVLEGGSPVAWSMSNPITLFIIQAVIVIVLCRLLTYPLRYLQQPRVIAEVIAGIILGPSVMMRIPGFQATIFPTLSMPVFNNVANLGLIIFLFLVDIRLFTNNWRVALSVGLAGMVLPFGLGFAIAIGLYDQFHQTDPSSAPIGFGVYGLFIGTALAITAFPVLCRILTELKLLSTNVGVTVLAAGIGNDVTGWILLALCVALVNNSSGLAALWALLCAAGWAGFLVVAVRPCFLWCLRRTGSLHTGPTQGMVALTLLLVLLSAWFTGIIGVHPIFGAFLVGLICPHDGGFAIKLTEKIEDFISVLFLPLYFALSGLSTNLGLLDDGITWAYVIAIIAVAFAGKIIGGTLAARVCGLLWRESVTIGCLMSCKGLVELIVLNIGLQARILSTKTFTMFVVMALVTTVSTTPLTRAFYPAWYQKKVDAWRRGEIDWDGNPVGRGGGGGAGPDGPSGDPADPLNSFRIGRLLVYLRLDSLASLFTFISLLGNEKDASGRPQLAPPPPEGGRQEQQQERPPGEDGSLPPPPAVPDQRPGRAGTATRRRPLEVHGVRLLELTDRTSSVMRAAEGEEHLYSHRDPVLNAFRTFSRLNDVAVAGRVAVVPIDSYAETLMAQAAEIACDFALIPWSESGILGEDQSVPSGGGGIGGGSGSGSGWFAGGGGSQQLAFIQQALQEAAGTCSAGIFVNNGLGGGVGGAAAPTGSGGGGGAAAAAGDRPSMKRTASGWSFRSNYREMPALPLADKSHGIFLPFLGGVDDRVALHFVLQLARNPLVAVTVVHFSGAGRHPDAAPFGRGSGYHHKDEGGGDTDNDTGVTSGSISSPSTGAAAAKTAAKAKVVERRGKEEESAAAGRDLALLSTLRRSSAGPAELIGRVTLVEVPLSGSDVVSEAVARAHAEVGRARNAGDIVVVGRRHARLGEDGAGGGAAEADGGPAELRRALGVLGEQMVLAGLRASVLVVQAGGAALESY